MYFFKWCYIQLQAFHNNYYIECPDYFEWPCFVVVFFSSRSVSIKLVLVTSDSVSVFILGKGSCYFLCYVILELFVSHRHQQIKEI